MSKIEAFVAINPDLCKQPPDCPLRDFCRRVPPETTLQEAKELMPGYEVTPTNDSYAASLPEPISGRLEDFIVTGNCTKGVVEGVNYDHCGSVLLGDVEKESRDTEDHLAVETVVMNWQLNNIDAIGGKINLGR